MTISNGDWLLFANNVVLGIFLVPTLLKRTASVHVATAAVYVVMIVVGAMGYFMNGQWLPGIPTAFGALGWAYLFFREWRRRS